MIKQIITLDVTGGELQAGANIIAGVDNGTGYVKSWGSR